MAEEVTIVVKQEAQGTALTDAKKQLEDLKKEQIQPSGAAPGAVRVEADATRHTKDRHAEEVKITKQKEAQAAIGKAQLNHAGGGMGGARMMGELLDMTTGTQGWVFRAMMLQRSPHMLAALAANPVALGVAAAAAPIAAYGAYSLAHYNEAQGELSFTNHQAEAAGAFSRQTGREKTYGTSSSALQQEEDQLREQAAALRDKKTEMVHQQTSGFRGWLDGEIGTNWAAKTIFGTKRESQVSIERNDSEADRLETEANSKAKQRREQFKRDTGLDIAQGEALEKRDMNAVRRIGYEKEWWKEYYRVKGGLGKDPDAEATASQAADTKVTLMQRDQAAQFGHLVNARSGAGDIARLASLAREQRTGEVIPDHGHLIRHLTESVNANHTEALGHNSVKKFSTLP